MANRVRDDLGVAERAAFDAGLRSLTTIDSVARSEIGTPAGTRRPVIDSSYSAALIAWFADLRAHDAYQAHPTHDAFRKTCSGYWTKVQIYDLELAPAAPAGSPSPRG